MRNFKKILTIVLAVVMLISAATVSAFAASKFKDVNEDDEALTRAVALLEGVGITKGTSETTFGTAESVTRQQMAAFIYRLMKGGKSLEGGENTTPFDDLYDDTYYGMISWANSQGIIKGISATKFDPDGGIILQDAYTMLVRALGYEKGIELSYPYGYIDIAERTGVALNKDLPATVTYERKLTRGNVAILLYNAFYAQKATEEDLKQPGTDDSSSTKKESTSTGISIGGFVIEIGSSGEKKTGGDVFAIKEEEYTVRATANYAFNDSADKDTWIYEPIGSVYGDDVLYLVAKNEKNPLRELYMTLEELGLSGTSDKYILNDLKLNYSYNDKEEKIEKLYSADVLGKQTSASSASFERYSYEKHFYPSATSVGCCTGKVTVLGKVLYFFDAPYNFAKPAYDPTKTAEERNNSENTKLIELYCLDKDLGTYTYYVTDDKYISYDQDAKFITKFNTAISNGYFLMNIYDPDGDGKYEYMWYRPATFGRISMDEDHVFTEEHTGNSVINATDKSVTLGYYPTIYANEARLSGVSFRDGDFVMANLNPQANTIHIFDVAVSRKGVITALGKDLTYGLTIGTQPHYTYKIGNYFDNYYINPVGGTDIDPTIIARFWDLYTTDSNLGRSIHFYSCNWQGRDHLLYYTFLDQEAYKYSGEKLLVVLGEETRAKFNPETNETDQLLKVWVDGQIKNVPLNLKKTYPDYGDATQDETYRIDKVMVTGENGRDYHAYYGKLCTYTVESNGSYTLHSLFHAQNSDGKADHVNLIPAIEDFAKKNQTNQAGNDLEGDCDVRLVRSNSTRYKLVDANGVTMLGTYGDINENSHWFEKYAYVDNSTRIIIRTNKAEIGETPDYEFHTYTGANFPGTMESYMKNVQYIYTNRDDDTASVNLVLLYGELDDGEDLVFESTTKKTTDRIIVGSNSGKDDNGKFRYFYRVIDPATGEIEENVPGTTIATTGTALAVKDPLESGSFVTLTAAGEVNDKKTPEKKLDAKNNLGMSWVLTVEDNDKLLELEPIDQAAEDALTFGGVLYNVVQIDDKTNITLIRYDKVDTLIGATAGKSSLAEIALGKNNIKSFNTKVEVKERFETKYAKYVKVFVTCTKGSKDEYPIAETVLIIINPDEPIENLDIKEHIGD